MTAAFMQVDRPSCTLSIHWRGTETRVLRERWAFMRARKKIWLLPTMVLMVLVGILRVFAQSSALAPFIHTIY
ncbi:MAG: DUF5989 family protein [bacterium]